MDSFSSMRRILAIIACLWCVGAGPRLAITVSWYQGRNSVKNSPIAAPAASRRSEGRACHARATRVQAALRVTGNRVVLTMEDNGIGFDLQKLRSAPASVSAGIGLRSIREQVQGLGGIFEIESGPLGTKLVVSVVVAPSEY